MEATIIIEKEMYNIIGAQNVGLSNCGLVVGMNTLTFSEAIDVIGQFDKALLSCPKYLRKRVLATRNQIVYSFGPEMEERLQ